MVLEGIISFLFKKVLPHISNEYGSVFAGVFMIFLAIIYLGDNLYSSFRTERNFRDAVRERNQKLNRILRDIKFTAVEVFADMGYIKFFERNKKSVLDEYRKERVFTYEDSSNLSIEPLTYDELKDDLMQATCERLAIVGPAGCGKSTLLKRLNRDLSKSKKMIVFLNFLDITVKEKISPCELFFQTLNCDKSVREGGYKWLVKNQENVIFLLDGLDQVTWSLQNGTRHVGEKSEGSTSEIISNIFSKKLFPNIQVVYTSREHAISSLDGDLRPDKVISITGLSDDNVKYLFTNELKDGERLWGNVSSSLKPLLSIPAFLTLAKCVYASLSNSPPLSVTEIMQKLFSKFERSKHMHKQYLMDKRDKKKLTENEKDCLGKLSYQGMKLGKLTFKREDFEKAELDWDRIKDLVIEVPGYGGKNYQLFDGDEVVILLHQVIQEFFAGKRIAQMDLETFRITVEHDLALEYWSVVTRFVAGLLFNKKTKPELMEISNLVEKQEILKEMLSSKYGKGQAVGGGVACMLSTLASIAESEDGDFVKSFVKGISLSNYPIGKSGLLSIASVMCYCNHMEVLHIQNCNLDAEGLRFLWENVKDSVVEIDKLNVSSNKELGDGFHYICKIASSCNVRELDAMFCKLRFDQLSSLREMKQSQLRALHLTGKHSVDDSDIPDQSSTFADSVFTSIDEIIAVGGKLTLGFLAIPSSALLKLRSSLNKKKISHLSFDDCILDKDCFQVIGEIVNECQIEKLSLTPCSISFDKLNHLLDAMK